MYIYTVIYASPILYILLLYKYTYTNGNLTVNIVQWGHSLVDNTTKQ